MSEISEQGEFNFSERNGVSGLDRWREQRREAQREVARRLGLPLDQPVEVWLVNGIRLRGRLQMADPFLFVEEDTCRALKLEVEGVSFTPDEIESCVRQD